MTLRLSAHYLEDSVVDDEGPDRCADLSSSEDEDDGDLTWEDWVSDSGSKRPCKSLFEDTSFSSVTESLDHDQKIHNFDLNQLCSRLGLDSYQRIRLINWIRKEKPSPEHVNALKGDEAVLNSDEYLKPSIEDDPLLEMPADDWSDEEVESAPAQPPSDLESAMRQIKRLQQQVQQSQRDLIDYKTFVSDRLNLASLAEALKEPEASSSAQTAQAPRDDDSHYFQSYGENDIHAVMIQDKVRTATYASFILNTSELFRDAIVLDVGCGTGILSLFAARAGAKRVFAVDASPIAERAEQIVKANNLENVITVIRGKVEDIKLPDDVTHVDVIISEWMGYALLYESMLDSVLHARDRFLKPDDGVMAPSQCQMMFGLCEAADIYKERVGFWGDVYGFDLSAMGKDVYEDAIVDVVVTMASEPVVVKDLHLKDITTKQLDFSSSFTLTSTTDRKTKIHAFVLYFDTFFSPSGEPIPEGTKVHVVREEDPILAEVWQVGGKRRVSRRMSSVDPLKKPQPKITSFSTGPLSTPTHWKQTLFLLRDPIAVHEGTVVHGTFICKKSQDNSRELDVEIHYTVKNEDEEPSEAIVQVFRVR
ncbi:hypothetical protein QCA50_006589 [Cerrena zonata]|uniref:type I protein arginine methyltransferase n=1 Tax=Cerrena zonata TaxID=2478898 RepID=A0AAW0GJN4_9APHY